MRTVVDTNLLVSTVTDRDAAQRSRAEELFRAAAEGQIAILVPQCVLFELLFVLRNVYEQKPATIRTLIAELTTMPGVQVVDDLEIDRWLKGWAELFPDAVDAAVASVAHSTMSRVATFDRGFLRRLRRAEIATW